MMLYFLTKPNVGGGPGGTFCSTGSDVELTGVGSLEGLLDLCPSVMSKGRMVCGN